MHWLVVLAIILVLFGAGKLPRVMGDFAKGIKAFKSGMKEEDEEAAAAAAPPAQVTPPAAAAASPRRPATSAASAVADRAARSARLSRRPAKGHPGWPRRRRAHARARDILRPVPNDRLEIRRRPGKGPRRFRPRADRARAR